MASSRRNGENHASSEAYKDGASFIMQRNFKVFARAVFALNKVGDELYLEPSREGLALRSLNCNKSAYAAFLFSTTFFASCDVDKINDDEYNLCRISMKPALMAFKCAKSFEKSVLACHLFINPRAETMLVQLTHTYDVVKSHEISLLECTIAFRNIVDKVDLKDGLTVASSLFSSLLSEIRQETADVTFSASKDIFAVKNYISRDQEFEKLIKTEVKVPITEFERYIVPKEAEITVNLKEIKAFVLFADYVQSPLNFYFEEAGSPLVIALENDVHFTADLVVATVDNDCSVIEHNDEHSLPVRQSNLPSNNSASASCKGASYKRVSVNLKDKSSSRLPYSSAVQKEDCGLVSFSTPVKRRCQNSSSQEKYSFGPEIPEDEIIYQEKMNLDFVSKTSGIHKRQHYFLSSSQRTLDASQLFINKSIIVPDSDEED